MSDLKDPLYKYWLSYTLSLNYLKEGIYGFVNQFAKQHHSNLLQSYIKGTGSPANSCTECTSDNLLPDHPRHQCIQKFRSKCFCNNPVGRRKCPNNFCSRLYDLIVIAHDERNPLWINTDPTKWYMDHWEIAKCYLSTPGYLEKRTAADTDTAGLLSIIENNIEIRTYVDCIDNIRKVRDVRNNIMHSKSFQVDQSSLYQYIDQMILVLKDPKILVTDAAAQNAVIKLEKLKTDQVYMSLKDAYEMERQAFKAGEDGKREIEKQHKEVFHQMEFEREEIHDNLDLDFDQRLLEQKMNIKPMAILMQTEVKEFERSYQTAEDVIELKGWQITDNSNAYFESRVKDYENKIEKQGSSTIEHDDYLFSSSWDEDTKKSGPGYDPNEWDRCIIRKSEPDANILLEREILPSKRELNRAMHVFGRNSDIFSYICSTICQRVRKLQNVVNVLPSYKEGYESIIFCVTLKKKSTFFEFEDYEYCIRCENEVSDEGDHVAEYETKDETMSQFDNTTFEKLRKCINNNADDLLKRHSNINVILPSLVKSIGYETGKPNMKQVPCIAIYVTVKGCIPLNETPFPKYIDGFPTDVLEGEYELFVKGPNEYHEHLKIGLAIHANVLNGDGILGGTLGGFIDHSKYGLCGITCAHVVYSADELIGIKDKKQFCLRKTVYQPIYDGSSAFGEVVETVYDEGSPSSSGMEVVLFSIQKRQPMDGSFPRTLNDHEAGFDASNPLCFNSGETCEINEIKRRTEVYKFGMSSGITRGSFALQGAVLHKSQMQGNSHGFDFRLMNQIVVLKIGDNSFAEPGDSGALVLIEGGHDSTAIGIVAGGMKGRVFVTPICDILRAVGCTELKMHKFTPTCTQLSTDSGVAMEVC